jgi:hypothetical protein
MIARRRISAKSIQGRWNITLAKQYPTRCALSVAAIMNNHQHRRHDRQDDEQQHHTHRVLPAKLISSKCTR